jgi:HSP20 family protein
MASRFLTPFGGRGLLARDPFVELNREINRLFDDPLRGALEAPRGTFMLSPSVDIDETEEGWKVTAELPGVAQEDIDLRLDGDILTISGEKRQERKDEKSRFVERSYGSFTRSFQLPFTPDANKIEADCDKGVLTVTIPKSVEQDRSRKIAISGSGKTIESKTMSGQSAVGKDWNKQSELKAEQAEKGQGAPA